MKLFNRTTIIGPILPDRQASWPQAAKAPDPGQCHPPKWSFSSRPTSDCSLISDDRRDLLKAKFVRGTSLARTGLLWATWRVPSQLANRGIWAASDATSLHEALVSLPLWPFMTVVVSGWHGTRCTSTARAFRQAR